MSKDNVKSSWIFGETVGTWLTRRLSEEFSRLENTQKLSQKGNPLDPKKWLSEKAIVDYSHLGTLEKAETLHIGREDLRKRLSRYLGYYGYPLYINSEDANQVNISIMEDVTKDFRRLVQTLPTFTSRCPFCTNDTNYFLGIESKINTRFGQKKVKRFYVGSHNYKQFGAAHSTKVVGSFEVEIIICEECLAKHEMLFIQPTSKTLKEIISKLKSNSKKVAQILETDPSTITRIVKGHTSSINENLLKKIIGLWQTGNLIPYKKLTTAELYKEYMADMVKVVIGEIDLESLVSDSTYEEMRHYQDGFLDVEDGFYLESSNYETQSFNFDKDGIYIEVKATDFYTKNIRDMIYSQVATLTLLFTLATPDSDLGNVRILESYISRSERVS